ncbi:cation transporter [Xanthobacter sp. KR7-65]|uniref:cation diffusion facilitator family transporter n=1 Tax=Xanthobacter sp. KR7-65 TaxID=3156612 RepID=UPI0032B3AA05
MRVPSATDLQKERAILFAILLDFSVFVPYVITVSHIGSIAMMAEMLRGGLLLVVEGAALLALRSVHRGRTYFYDFGIGKLERMLSAGVGALLLLAAVFILVRVMQADEPAPLPPVWVAIAIGLVVYNLFTNVAPLLPLWRATRAGTSIIVLSQFRARIAKAVASVTVVVCVALDVLLPGTQVALLADDIGGLVGAAFMVVIGGGMISEALPDLLDRALGEPLQLKVNAALAAHFDRYEQLIGVRTRKSGSVAHVEITVGFAPERTIADVSAVTGALRSALQSSIPDADVVVIAAPYVPDR